ncbi:early transcribed membrane protein [Hepatocystis sp. ex Piliocolobus tephrosceles]|nr:early transcribed membrane protein [Hepatocystis sp. ex Piliocolobus tephrosceles]
MKVNKILFLLSILLVVHLPACFAKKDSGKGNPSALKAFQDKLKTNETFRKKVIAVGIGSLFALATLIATGVGVSKYYNPKKRPSRMNFNFFKKLGSGSRSGLYKSKYLGYAKTQADGKGGISGSKYKPIPSNGESKSNGAGSKPCMGVNSQQSGLGGLKNTGAREGMTGVKGVGAGEHRIAQGKPITNVVITGHTVQASIPGGRREGHMGEKKTDCYAGVAPKPSI